MEQKKFNTKRQKYTHIKESERYKIEVLLQDKKKPKDIAIILGRGRSTIYKEIKRGTVERLQYDLSKKEQYRADVAQRDYKAKVTGKEHELKKFEVAWELIEQGHDILTEVIFKNKKRADIVDLTEGIVYEILKSETIEQAKNKVRGYPDYFAVEFIKV